MMRTSREPTRWLVPLFTTLAYLFGYGWAVLVSVLILAQGYGSTGQTRSGSGTGSSSASDVTDFIAESAMIVLGLLCAAVAVGLLGRPAVKDWLIGCRSRLPGRGCLVAGALLLADLAGFWMFALMSAPQPATDPATHAAWYDIGNGLLAGAIGEELIVLALPIVVIRRLAPHLLARPWPAVGLVAVLVIARIAYHLYQGAWAGSHVLWALAAVLLYLWTGRVWPQILAHAFYDTTLALYEHHRISQPGEMLLLHGVAVALLVLGSVLAARGRRRPAAVGTATQLTPTS